MQSNSHSLMVSRTSYKMFIKEMCSNFVFKISYISLISLLLVIAWYLKFTKFLKMSYVLLRAV